MCSYVDMSPQHPGVARFMNDHFATDGYVPKGSKKDIAAYVGVSGATVGRWFAGHTTIDREHWPLLAACAGTTETVLADYLADTDSGESVPALIERLAAEAAADRRDVQTALRDLTAQMVALTDLVQQAAARGRRAPGPSSPGSSRSKP